MPLRVIAIDWSGAKLGAERRIWLAEVENEQVIRLEAGRSRPNIVEHVIHEAERDSHLVVGFDFAFSFPTWFLQERGLDAAPALWELVGREGERWLAECTSPFWGRPGVRCPDLPAHFRQTDREVPAISGIRPKSVFQVGGAGAVGTGSLRGMPVLTRLRQQGFAVWPFDPPRLPLAVEIYPRALTGAVIKGSAVDRRRYLETKHPTVDGQVLEQAAGSEDAFDALVSALVMARHVAEFELLPTAASATHRLEGQIWIPAGVIAEPASF